jgi:putative colanic acid biosynthesis glycosyltransferase
LIAQLQKPFFSIVTVVLNDMTGFSMTRDSVHAQTFRDLEWIVIDGGSTDGTIDSFAKPETQITKWLSEKDSGIYDAMNKGIKLCSGQYILFLNAGDVFSNFAVLKKVNERLREGNEPSDILFGGTTLVLPNGARIYRAPRAIEAYIWHGLPAYHQATYYRRDRLKDTMYDLNYQICGDYYLVAKLFMQGLRATYLDSSLVDFRFDDNTSIQNPRSLFLETYSIQKNVLKLSILTRCASLMKRFFSTLGIVVLSLPSFLWLLKSDKKLKIHSK